MGEHTLNAFFQVSVQESRNQVDMESLLFVGRCVSALALNIEAIEHNGSVLISGEVAQQYGFNDIYGKYPMLLRSELW